jgi:hypothetical protein
MLRRKSHRRADVANYAKVKFKQVFGNMLCINAKSFKPLRIVLNGILLFHCYAWAIRR